MLNRVQKAKSGDAAQGSREEFAASVDGLNSLNRAAARAGSIRRISPQFAVRGCLHLQLPQLGPCTAGATGSWPPRAYDATGEAEGEDVIGARGGRCISEYFTRRLRHAKFNLRQTDRPQASEIYDDFFRDQIKDLFAK
eukprot:scaffold301_cov243-Pinguiococcus_pyrenoidosus.AAC.144